jgi:phenylacetate-coenzyme A ligase PaaK-like adenylate-forming protein
MRGLEPAAATVEDLASLPAMSKEDAQEEWDAIVTVPGMDRGRAERILAEQRWFSYTPGGEQVFSSGGSSGVRGVYLWDWDLLVTLACLAWRMQVREERRTTASPEHARLAVLTAGEPPHASTPLFDVPTHEDMETVVVAAGQPFDEIRTAVEAARPTHLVGYASVVSRLARASLVGELHIEPLRVSTNSEPLSGEERATIATAWNAPIHNLWGSTEIGVRPWAAAGAMVCTCARTRSYWSASTEMAGPLRRRNRRPGRWLQASQAEVFPSSATTSATR